MSEPIKFRAHARLLTMLGEQLIKNERVALVELIKNSYDADATHVSVDFIGFGPRFEATTESSIVITDDGHGMSEEVVRTTWMNPATPTKAIQKSAKPTTERGRVLQGEKGIGRFATFKLGNQVSMVTRAKGSAEEVTILVDISALDEEAQMDSRDADYFLDQLPVTIESGIPMVFAGTNGVIPSHGTQIEIKGLRADWSRQLVELAFADLDRLQPQLWDDDAETDATAETVASDFSVSFYQDGVDLELNASRAEEFKLILSRAVLKIEDGRYDSIKNRFEFSLNGRPIQLPLDGPDVRGLRRFKKRFLNADKTWAAPTCGSFGFEFYIFDLSRTASAEYLLDDADKEVLKQHRIYLYRDGIRVYPYGDPGDDWLEIDAIRGTESARSMFSNDQSVGFVTISQSENPGLRDKTSREGLIDNGPENSDFVGLVQTVLDYLRSRPYQQYNLANRRVREKSSKHVQFDKHIHALRSEFDLPNRAIEYLDSLEKAVASERELSAMQVARTEQLAGVGLSVETASHDLIASGSESLRLAKQVVAELSLLDLKGHLVYRLATDLTARLEFVNSRFKDVQGLFVSTRQKASAIDIGGITRRVRSMYRRLHENENIVFEIDDGLEFKAVSTEAAVLQCLINLVDNATYWLMATDNIDRKIRVFSMGQNTLVVTDSGPGIRDEDAPFIFEAFYSGKGDAGKGLGLYIAEQNGLRNKFSIAISGDSDHRLLPGASFYVEFDEVVVK